MERAVREMNPNLWRGKSATKEERSLRIEAIGIYCKHICV